MENSRGKGIPADPCSSLTKTGCSGESDSNPFDEDLYREAVGTLMYIAVCTRPDIAYAVGRVAQFCSAPKKAHWAGVQRVMAYLKETARLGITDHQRRENCWCTQTQTMVETGTHEGRLADTFNC